MDKRNPKAGVKEITERLFALEEELGLFDRKIAGEPFWELLRSSMHRKILGETGVFSRKESPGKRSLGYVFKVGVHVLENTLFHNPFFAPRSDVLFFGMNRRRLERDGLWHDIYCDPLIAALQREGIRCCMVEQPPFSRPVPKSVKTQALYYLDFLEFCFLGIKRFGFGRVGFSQDDLAFLANVQERLDNEFGTHLDMKLQLELTLQRENILSFLYKLLLRNIAPKAVIAADLSAKKPLIRACKEMNVPLIEIHQGAIHRYSLEYSFEGPRRKKERIPDYFFAFGDFWKHQVALPLPAERVKSVGFPYYEQQLERYKNVKQKNQIVFLSQPTSRGSMARFAVELAKLLGDVWQVVYKLHPEESVDFKERYPELLSSSVQVVRDDEKPLYELLAESQVQVGTNSTALYEGLGFGLRTFLLETPEMETMYLLEAGYACQVGSPQEMRALLTKQETPQKGEEFFRRGALPRMVELVRKIISS